MYKIKDLQENYCATDDSTVSMLEKLPELGYTLEKKLGDAPTATDVRAELLERIYKTNVNPDEYKQPAGE